MRLGEDIYRELALSADPQGTTRDLNDEELETLGRWMAMRGCSGGWADVVDLMITSEAARRWYAIQAEREAEGDEYEDNPD